MDLLTLWDAVSAWVGPWFWWLTAASAVMLVGTALLLPVLIIRMRPDYFVGDEPPTEWSHQHPAVRLAIRIGRNIAGAVLLAAGIVMLVTPGQGMLSILAGISLLDVPGKRRLERRLVQLPYVLAALNAIRRKARRPPLLAPPSVAPVGRTTDITDATDENETSDER
jgi:hypothetical protein